MTRKSILARREKLKKLRKRKRLEKRDRKRKKINKTNIKNNSKKKQIKKKRSRRIPRKGKSKIEILKKSLIKEHGTKPTITFYYYCWNVVDYAGEEIVRRSFESIQGQGDEVIVGMYDPKDNTAEIAKEYGIKPVVVEKDPNDCSAFPESKVRNKVIMESKCNYLIPLNIHVKFNKNFGEKVRERIKKLDPKKKMLKIRYKFESKDGTIGKKYYGKSQCFYKPYLIAARGYDERTGFCAGSQRYGGLMMIKVFNLKKVVWDTDMYHMYHHDHKIPTLRKIFSESVEDSDEPKDLNNISVRKVDRKITKELHKLLRRDFEKNKRKVQNSYW